MIPGMGCTQKGKGMVILIVDGILLGFYDGISEYLVRNYLDKGKHLVTFSYITVAFMYASNSGTTRKVNGLNRLALTLSVLTILAVGSELLHGVIPGRIFDWDDVKANLLGVLLSGLPLIIVKLVYNQVREKLVHQIDRLQT